MAKKKVKKLPLIIITGGHGFVGSTVTDLLKDKRLQTNTPSKTQLDITNSKSIETFLSGAKSSTIINFASFTTIEEAEKQRGDKKTSAWQLNVEGAKKLASACKKFNVFLMHISTDNVFSGSEKDKGPYKESAVQPNNSKKLSWYGYTKLKGEKEIIKSKVKFAIIRISYPFGNPRFEKDLIKTINYIKAGVPFFIDQFITPTFIKDLANAIEKISLLKKEGVYHVVCNKVATPYEIAVYTAKKTKLRETINKMHIEEYLKKPNSIKRSQYGGLLNKETQRLLHIKFYDWQKAIDKFIYETK